MAKTPRKLVIKHHNPILVRGGWTVLVCLVLACGYGLFYYGRHTSGYHFHDMDQILTQERETAATLQAENERLRQELATLQSEQQVERMAYKDVTNSLGNLQEDILELREEVAFYRSIAAPQESSKGLRIQSFRLKTGSKPGSYRFRLLLSQVLKNERVTDGTVRIQLQGVQGIANRTLDLNDITRHAGKLISFKFKYFQDFEEELELPEGFKPQRFVIQVRSGSIVLDKQYAWQKLIDKIRA